MKKHLLLLAVATLFFPVSVRAQQEGTREEAAKAAKTSIAEPEKEPVVSHHEIKMGEQVLKYSVTAGVIPIKNDRSGETEGRIFFMAYTLDGDRDPAKRPLTFSFNGGPGSSSVWLHLGALGPRRVEMLDDGGMPAPPYRLVDNEYSWLDLTDMVFIDPVGTGFSRPSEPEKGKQFWGLEGDIQSVGEFIRMYLTRYERWSSPLFLIGESYGTTRAAGLSGYLVGRSGIGFNGVILVSTVLNFQSLFFSKGNDLPYLVYLPSLTATAWYHKRLSADLQADLRKTLDEVEDWTLNHYAAVLAKGDRLTPEEREEAIDKLARYTGLSREYVDRTNLRIEYTRFRKELLRDEKLTVGRLDSRFKGLDANYTTDRPDFDPSMAAIRPPYTAAFNDYVRTELGYESDLHYWILGGGVNTPWDFGRPGEGFPDTSEALRTALVQNPYMKVFVAYGYYDLATPYFGAEYTMSHLDLHPALRENITGAYYEAGHMMYIDVESLAKLKSDIVSFYASAMESDGRGVANVP
jgi:carboxypeptidase C (cathepsin A)